jgi:hypothetical protein
MGSKKESRKRHKLVYGIDPSEGGIVIARRDRAELISRIHDAIESATTWSEFRRLMPRSSYSQIIDTVADEQGARPKGNDPFDSSKVPGYADGDYPPWLAQEMEKVLPKAVVSEFATRRDSVLNGPYLHIDRKRLKELNARLSEEWFELEDGTAFSVFRS